MSIDNFELQSPRVEPQIFAESGRRKPDGKKAPAAEVGWFLMRERESRELSIEAASEATGIHPYHIEAIEAGDLTHMPHRLEAMEMIAGYAQFLGFDAEPLVEHMLSFMPAPPINRPNYHPARPPILSSAKILSFGKLPKIPSLNIRLANYPGGSGGIVASVAAAFMLYIGAQWAMSPSTVANAPAVEQTAQVIPAAPATDAMPTASTSPDVANVQVTDSPLPSGGAIANAAPAGDEDALGNFIQDQTEQPVVKPKGKKKLDKATVAEIPQPLDGRVYGAENADARIVLKATAPVWLRIEDQAGNPVMTQMLNTGDTYRVPNREGLIALSRDGGRLNYVIDGKTQGVLGPAGKILVSEKLDVASLEAKK
jgi:cytoskeleton protein RodZ